MTDASGLDGKLLIIDLRLFPGEVAEKCIISNFSSIEHHRRHRRLRSDSGHEDHIIGVSEYPPVLRQVIEHEVSYGLRAWSS